MDKVNSDDKDDDSLDNPLEEHVKNLNKKVIEKETEISQRTENITKNTTEFSNELRDAQSETEKDVENVNSNLRGIQSNVEDFFEKSRKTVTDTLDKFDIISSGVKRALLILFGCFVVIAFLGYFVFNYFFHDLTLLGIKLDPIILSGLVTAIGFIILVIKTSSSINSELISTRNKEIARVSKVEKDTAKINGIKLDFDFKNIHKRLSDIGDAASKVVTTTKEYLPGAKEYFSTVEQQTAQEYFALTVRNALENYSLLDDYSVDKLSKFSSWKNSEEEWLDKISRKLGNYRKIDPLIIKLCYYDYSDTDNSLKLKDTWSLIKNNDQAMEELSLILTQKLDLDSSKNKILLEKLKTMNPFSMARFLDWHNKFFVDFEKDKQVLVSIMPRLGFRLNENDRSTMLGFTPSSAQIDNWSDDLINKTSEYYGTNFQVMKLLYLDSIGDTKQKPALWSEIKLAPDNLRLLSNQLVTNGIIKSDDHESKTLKELCFLIMDKTDEFSLVNIQKTFAYEIYNVDRIKKTFAFALESKTIHIPEEKRDDYEQLMFYSHNREEEVAKYLENILGVPKKLLLLLYHEYNQDDLKNPIFNELKKEKQLEKLANILLNRGIVQFWKKTSPEVENANLAKLLDRFDDFDIQAIRKSYDVLKELAEDSDKLVEFLSEQEVTSSGTINFDELIDLLEKLHGSRYSSVKELAFYIFDNRNMQKLDPEKRSSVISSSLVLFFTKYADPAKKDACENAAANLESVQILYAWITAKEKEKLGAKKSTLWKVAESIFSGKFSAFEYINEFNSELANGNLFGSIQDLLGAKLTSISQDIKKISENDRYQNLLGKVSGSIKSLMAANITNDFIIHALNSQLISAYMITSGDGAIMKIVDKFMPDVCVSLAQGDPRYKELLILTDDLTAGGKGTRIGLVPLNVKDFEEFNGLFSTAFEKALDPYIIAERPKKQKQDFAAHLIRIFPSDLAFKLVQISSTTGISNQHPVNSIKDLVLKRLGWQDSIKIAASVNPSAQPTVALGKIIYTLFDNYTNIYQITDDLIKDIINGQSELMSLMNGGKFDEELQQIYSVPRLTDLSTRLSKMYKNNPQGTTDSLKKNIVSILEKHNIKLESVFQDRLTTSILERLTDLGGILNISPPTITT